MANTRIYTDEQVTQLVNFVLQSRGISGDAAELTHADVENYMHAGGRYAADGPGTEVMVTFNQTGTEPLRGKIVGTTLEEGNAKHKIYVPLDGGGYTHIEGVHCLNVITVDRAGVV